MHLKNGSRENSQPEKNSPKHVVLKIGKRDLLKKIGHGYGHWQAYE